jgi:F-type H+-transporting ATPase subunit epsilon
MASKTFRCRLVTPTESLLDEQVAYASIPAWDGLFGVLPGRAPIVARLGLGELSVRFSESGAGGTRSYLVDGGFVQMAGDTLTILAERATATESLVEADAQVELDAANKREVPKDAADRQAEVERINREKRRAALAVRLARSGRGRGI